MSSVKKFLSADQVIEIRGQHRKCHVKRYADRLKAILLLNDGYSYLQVAKILILDDATVRCWYNIFLEEGTEGLHHDLYKGGISKLDDMQLEALGEYVEKNVCLTAKSVCNWVEKEWGIEYSISGMTDLLHTLNFSYKKPTIVPGKHQSPEKQREFVAEIEKTIENKAPEDQVYFADACHPMLNPVAGYGWFRKGEEKKIQSNTGRERLNINGAYNPETKEAIVHLSDSVNAQSTIEMLEIMQKRQPNGNIIIFADNARYYKSKIINQYLQDKQRIKFIHLPAYSPNLNLIERLWKFYKKIVLSIKHYSKLEMLRQATLDFFDDLHNYAEEIESLMTMNFQIIESEFSEIRSR